MLVPTAVNVTGWPAQTKGGLGINEKFLRVSKFNWKFCATVQIPPEPFELSARIVYILGNSVAEEGAVIKTALVKLVTVEVAAKGV